MRFLFGQKRQLEQCAVCDKPIYGGNTADLDDGTAHEECAKFADAMALWRGADGYLTHVGIERTDNVQRGKEVSKDLL